MPRLSRRHPLRRENPPRREHPLSCQRRLLRLRAEVSVVSVEEASVAVVAEVRYPDNMATSKNRRYRKA